MPVNAHRISPGDRTEPVYGDVSWDRMIRAVEKVRQRLQRAAAALEAAGVPYAVAGGNAVAAWVSRVDEAAVRNTQHVDILLRRSDLQRAIAALTGAGFIYRPAASLDMFLDGPTASARDSVHVVFAAEKVAPRILSGSTGHHGVGINSDLPTAHVGGTCANEADLLLRQGSHAPAGPD